MTLNDLPTRDEVEKLKETIKKNCPLTEKELEVFDKLDNILKKVYAIDYAMEKITRYAENIVTEIERLDKKS